MPTATAATLRFASGAIANLSATCIAPGWGDLPFARRFAAVFMPSS